MDDDTPAAEPERQPAGGEATKYPRVVAAFYESPWAILPETLSVMRELVDFHAAGGKLTEDEIRARVGDGPAHRATFNAGAVAVLPLYGVIMPRATLMSDLSGGTSVQGFAKAFRAALADDDVGSIVIDTHSPGGSVSLVTELAAEIRAGRGTKPIVAVANTLMASAAYQIASQADELVVTPSGLVGSIGVYGAHQDLTGFEEKLGVKTTIVSAGKFKVEGHPNVPLTDEALAAIQDRIDQFYDQFVDDVAKGRGVSASRVRNGFGQGRVMTAKDALAEGAADRIDTYEATVARLLRGKGNTRPGSARSETDATALIEEVASELLETAEPAEAAHPGDRPGEDDGAHALGVALLSLAHDIRRTTTRRHHNG